MRWEQCARWRWEGDIPPTPLATRNENRNIQVTCFGAWIAMRFVLYAAMEINVQSVTCARPNKRSTLPLYSINPENFNQSLSFFFPSQNSIKRDSFQSNKKPINLLYFSWLFIHAYRKFFGVHFFPICSKYSSALANRQRKSVFLCFSFNS